MTTLAEQLAGQRVGLALASGFFGFYHHAGVLAALVDAGIRPVRISGTSAGALVAGMYGAGLEPDAVGAALLEVERRDFWDLGWPLHRGGVGLLAGNRMAAMLAEVLPVHGFAECRVPVSVGAYEVATGRVRHLEDGPLVPALMASCAVPYLFKPVELDGRVYWDGGVGEKTPLVPFLGEPEVDAVVVSYLPPREARGKSRRGGIRALLPSPSSFFVDTPPEERLERDRVSVEVLREAGKRVLVLAPERVWLGPFSLEKGPAALEQGRTGAAAMLGSTDEDSLGSRYLT
jgi:NTE family protein